MQGAHGAERSVVEQAVAAALLDSRGRDLAIGIEDEECQHFAFEAAGDGFSRVEFTPLVLLAELFTDFLLPACRPGGRFGRWPFGWRWRRGLGAFGRCRYFLGQHQFGSWRRRWRAQSGFQRTGGRWRCWGRRLVDQFADEGRQVQQQGSSQGQGEPVIGPEHEKMRAGLGSE